MPKNSEEPDITDEELELFQQMLAYLITAECEETVRNIRIIRERCDPAFAQKKAKSYVPAANDDWEEGFVGLS